MPADARGSRAPLVPLGGLRLLVEHPIAADGRVPARQPGSGEARPARVDPEQSGLGGVGPPGRLCRARKGVGQAPQGAESA